ncbi:hypothetical protein [Nocardia shimofusensis]|uniref:hypothetical protein n=1 Tax=Nocardia shimofusensis TaxID=228596 RepID=UPI0008362326|nr:hypothetical protein [Nocardia shimofusensis]
MKRDNEPMLDVVNGDIGMSRHLSKVLKIIADSPGVDKDLRNQLGEILAGKASFRDLARSESFTRLSEAAMPKIAADLAEQTPEQIQSLARAGEELLRRYRVEAPEASSTIDDEKMDSGSPRPGSEPSTRTPSSAPDDAPPSRSTTTPRHVVPGTRKPDRDRIVTPDEPDDDDLYYGERQRRGWLE